MKFMIWIGFLILVGVFLALVFVPKKRVVRKSKVFRAEIQTVWNQIRNIQKQTQWRSDLNSIEIQNLTPEVWKETNKNGITTSFQSILVEEPFRWEMKVIEPSYLEAKWTGILESTNQGTKVIFEESVSVDSLFYRIISFLFFDVNKVMNLYMKDLTLSLGEEWDENQISTTME